MPIEFKCPSCAKTIRVPEVHAGRKGHCPACNTLIRIPATGASNSTAIDKVKSGTSGASSPAVADSPESKSSESASSKAPGAKASPFIAFTCPSCDKRTGFPAALAGRSAPCPVCQANIMVPTESDGPSFVVGNRPGPAAAQAAAAEDAAKRSPLIYAVGGLAVAGLIFGIAFVAGKLGSSPPPPPATQVAQAPAPVPPTPTPAVLAPSTRDNRKSVVDRDAPPQDSNALPPPLPPAKEEPVARSAPSDEPKEVPFAQKVAEQMAAAEARKLAENAANDKKTPPAEDDIDAAPKKVKAPEKTPAAMNDAPDDTPDVSKPKSTPTRPENAEGDAPEKKSVAAKPAEPVAPNKAVPPPAAAPICAQCLGTGYLPLISLRPYIHPASEAVTATTAANAVPFRFCTKCGVGKDPSTLVAAETARLAAAPAIHKKWEEMAGTKLSYVETHHVTLRSTLPESELKIVAAAIEQLTTLLQTTGLSTVLAQTRPETDQILIGADQAGYTLFLDALKAQDPKSDWGLAKDSTGFMLPHMSVFNAQRGGGTGARAMALYQFGEMLMVRATDNKAPAWLRLGFASYCENVITHKNLVYAFQYEKNDVHFGENWDNDIKKYAAQAKLKTWDLVFNMIPIGATSLDYLTCYSMVNFFISNDPKLFPKLVVAIKEGLDSEHALMKVYSSDSKRMQVMWAGWAINK